MRAATGDPQWMCFSSPQSLLSQPGDGGYDLIGFFKRHVVARFGNGNEFRALDGLF